VYNSSSCLAISSSISHVLYLLGWLSCCVPVHGRTNAFHGVSMQPVLLQVAAVERMLTDIDELPEPFKSAEVVYLSKNCLSNLQVCFSRGHGWL
jgi:hypothetical protein